MPVNKTEILPASFPSFHGDGYLHPLDGDERFPFSPDHVHDGHEG